MIETTHAAMTTVGERSIEEWIHDGKEMDNWRYLRESTSKSLNQMWDYKRNELLLTGSTPLGYV